MLHLFIHFYVKLFLKKSNLFTQEKTSFLSAATNVFIRSEDAGYISSRFVSIIGFKLAVQKQIVYLAVFENGLFLYTFQRKPVLF